MADPPTPDPGVRPGDAGSRQDDPGSHQDDPGAQPRWPVFRMLLALVLIGVGVYLIATANKPTETVTARVSYERLAVSRADTVNFQFADGSEDSETEPGGLVEAVQKFGPGPARVTRNSENDSIYKVVFHDKTYSISDPGTDKLGGIIAIVVGALWFCWLLLVALPAAPAAPREEPAPTPE